MKIGTVEKHSGETYTYEVNYLDRLPAGASINTVTASSVCIQDGLAGSVTGTCAVSGSAVLVPLQGGTDGKSYLINLSVNLSNGNIIIDQIELRISNVPGLIS